MSCHLATSASVRLTHTSPLRVSCRPSIHHGTRSVSLPLHAFQRERSIIIVRPSNAARGRPTSTPIPGLGQGTPPSGPSLETGKRRLVFAANADYDRGV